MNIATKKIRAWVLLMITIFVLICIGVSYTADAEGIELYINHQNLSTKTEVIDKNGWIMVPLRDVIESIGGNVEWDHTTKTAIVHRDEKSIHFSIDKTIAVISHNGIPGEITIPLDTPPILHRSQTYVSIETIAEAFEAHIESIGPGKEVQITLPPAKGYVEFPNITDFGQVYNITAEKEKINLATADTFFVTYKYNDPSLTKEKITDYCKGLMAAGFWETPGHSDELRDVRAFYSAKTKVHVMVTYANNNVFVSIGSKITPDELAVRKILLALEAKGAPNYERMSGQTAYNQDCTKTSITSQYTFNAKNILEYKHQLLKSGFVSSESDDLTFVKDDVTVELVHPDTHAISIQISIESDQA